MGRIPRPNLPGVAFHLTQRLQNGAHLLTPRLRWQVVHLLRHHAKRSDARLLAYVVMTNHLHVVLIQGEQPLWRLMQPFLLSVSLAVHQAHGTQGHAFERRYRDRICRDSAHLRNAIAYTHANPVRAGLCAQPSDYPWSSHREYARGRTAGGRPLLDLGRGLEAFGGHRDRRRASDRYVRFLDGVIHHAALGARDNGQLAPSSAANGRPTAAGQEAAATSAGEQRVRRLEHVAIRVIDNVAPATSIDEIRSRWGPRSKVSVRRAIAVEAHREGFRLREIADFLDISKSSISRILNTPIG